VSVESEFPVTFFPLLPFVTFLYSWLYVSLPIVLGAHHYLGEGRNNELDIVNTPKKTKGTSQPRDGEQI
jgi:hypothetical protein